ncbi:MAG: lytic transglycosylase domain-containing protein, partial [Desulfobacterales bacterium]|nr:lytic transglycosylase domain-containing protein [Desulfobacterales bacterium]
MIPNTNLLKNTLTTRHLWVWAHGLTLLMVPTPAHGDIYRYVDSEGTVHFSNVPTSSKYQIYIRETPPRPALHRPSRYDPYIAEAARKHGVPFSLIRAIIKVESDFDPDAISSAGACGLMQIMPQTAKALGVMDPFDPRENIFGGVRYLKELLTQFRGSLPLALAAYNAGPH